MADARALHLELSDLDSRAAFDFPQIHGMEC